MGRDTLKEFRRVRRRRMLLRSGLFVFCSFFILGLALSAVFYTPRFTIKEIKFEGEAMIPLNVLTAETEAILNDKVWGIFPQNRIFSAPYETLKSRLMDKFKRLKSVEFGKKYSQVLTVKVVERQPEALLCVSDSKICFYLDKAGYIFEEAPFFSEGIYLQFFDERNKKPGLGEYLMDGKDMGELHGFISLLKQNYDIVSARLLENGIYHIYVEEGWYLLVDKKEDISHVYENFLTAVPEIKSRSLKGLEYIDLRFGNKIYYKYKTK